MIKYSKSYSNIFKIKEDYVNHNQKELSQILKINRFYKKQKKRKSCKICNRKLEIPTLKSFEIEYFFCTKCNHLNGKYEDTEKFHDYLYSGEQKKYEFGKVYCKNFSQILKYIHYPKAIFLKQVLKNKKINLLDLGSGGGHFVKACLDKKINAWGVEKNPNLVKFSQKHIKDRIFQSDTVDLIELINSLKVNCLSLIFTLEHLKDPHYIFNVFKKTNLKYLYIAVPLASPLIFFENIFQKIYPRHLGGSHTHLFTEESLNYLKKKYKLKMLGEWWFGTEIADLYRSLFLSNNFHRRNSKIQHRNKINKFFLKNIDSLQSIFDKNKICSELHTVLKRK